MLFRISRRKSRGGAKRRLPTGRAKQTAARRITQPIMFNTPEADQILSELQIFPPNNPWNEDISKRPIAANSRNLIASVGPDKSLAYNLDMAFILVPPDQRRVPVRINQYPEESDPGPYPVPDNAPIENWPLSGQPLETIQRTGAGDRHMIVLDPVKMTLFEFYIARKTASGWVAAQASIFYLKSNKLRRMAGPLPMPPACPYSPPSSDSTS